MSNNVTGLPLSQGILVPAPNVDAEYMNGDQPWESINEYLSYKDSQYATIFRNKTILVRQSDGTAKEMCNSNTDSARTFILKISNDTYTKDEIDNTFQPKGNYLTEHQSLKTINGQVITGTGNITIPTGSGGGSSIDDNLLSALKYSMPLANNIIDANVDLPLFGYISQATHTFIESTSERFRCSGPISVRGASNVTFSANAWCNHTDPDDYDLVQMVFLDKDMNAIPDLDIRVDDITTKSVNLLSEEYKDVYYVILSGDTNGHGIPNTYLKIKGIYNFNNFLTPDNFTYRQGYNLFDVNKIEYKKGITSGGDFIDDKEAIVSNLIELPDDRGRNGDLWLFNLPETRTTKRFIYYDKDMNVVAGPGDIGAANTQAQINCKPEAKYFRISIIRAVNPLPSEEEIKTQLKNVMITFYYSMTEYQPHWKHIDSINGSNLCASSVSGLYAGKKWAVLGDSLTERNNHSAKFYHDYVKEWLGFTVENMGNSGTGYMCRQDVGTAFYQRIENIPDDVDVLTIFGSFNDISQNLPLGTISDTETTSICGCVNTLLNWIFTNRPNLKFGIIAPCPWKELTPKGDTSDSNSAIAYVAALKQICEKNSIPFLDLFHNSGLRPWDRTFRDLFYNRDQQTEGDYHGTHPNEKGHEFLATRIKEFVKQII